MKNIKYINFLVFLFVVVMIISYYKGTIKEIDKLNVTTYSTINDIDASVTDARGTLTEINNIFDNGYLADSNFSTENYPKIVK